MVEHLKLRGGYKYGEGEKKSLRSKSRELSRGKLVLAKGVKSKSKTNKKTLKRKHSKTPKHKHSKTLKHKIKRTGATKSRK